MEKIYNENSYYLKFPKFTSPNKINNYDERDDSLPSFLGYNTNIYYPYKIYSNKSLPLISDSQSIDTNRGAYFVNESNNYFTIIKYIGPNKYTNSSIIDLSFNIQLTLNGVVSRNQLVNDLSNQLTNNKFLIDSSIKRQDIIDPSNIAYEKSVF